MSDFTITGRVAAVTEDQYATCLVIEREEGDYPERTFIAVRAWRKNLRARAGEWTVGATVRVEGTLKSKPWKARWFTDFEADAITVRGGAQPAAPESPPPSDDDDVPF